jgi:hypothetical protein
MSSIICQDIFRRCEFCLEAGVWHFETVAWNKAILTTVWKVESKYPEDAGFLCDRAAILKDMIKNTLCNTQVEVTDS